MAPKHPAAPVAAPSGSVSEASDAKAHAPLDHPSSSTPTARPPMRTRTPTSLPPTVWTPSTTATPRRSRPRAPPAQRPPPSTPQLAPPWTRRAAPWSPPLRSCASSIRSNGSSTPSTKAELHPNVIQRTRGCIDVGDEDLCELHEEQDMTAWSCGSDGIRCRDTNEPLHWRGYNRSMQDVDNASTERDHPEV